MKPEPGSLEVAERAAGLNRIAHYYWPSEWPVSLCGHIAEFPTLGEAQRIVPGPVCDMCSRHAAAKPERPNPIHPQQGG